jgi:hypothetical protein
MFVIDAFCTSTPKITDPQGTAQKLSMRHKQGVVSRVVAADNNQDNEKRVTIAIIPTR